jgi:hypothetical protein
MTRMGKSQEIRVEPLELNLSPEAFHRYAVHYYKCKQDFQSPDGFSPVPYFLLCRAIELEIKSRHLKKKRQTEVKREYSHRLMQAYNALTPSEQVLTPSQVEVLEAASKIYASKGFEYFKPQDALTGFSRYPDLTLLDSIAKRLIGIYPQVNKNPD